MAKRKELLFTATSTELLRAKKEVAKMFKALRTGQIDEKEFRRWWERKVAFKGRDVLHNLLKQRELARGWNTRTRSSS